jgi:WhiB family transcriptional regulator, redox-sensing transcriptional regulator
MRSADHARGPAAWMSHGACQGEDPELFFPVTATGPALQQITRAKAVCGRCTVRVMCLAYAWATGQSGIWGGTTGEERHVTAGQPIRLESRLTASAERRRHVRPG